MIISQKKKIRVVLADSSVREIDSMIKTSFWSPEGNPLTATEFINSLFGEIPKFFKSEKDLIKIWSNPDTRKKLIELANILNVKVSEHKFKESDVYKADRVFITNSSAIILEANKLNGKPLNVNNNAIINNIKSEILKVINHE